jgi:hypothetical protein
MTPERAKELVLNKINRAQAIAMGKLTNSFNGRIHAVRAIVEELAKEDKIIIEAQNNKHGPKSIIIVSKSAKEEPVIVRRAPTSDENPDADLLAEIRGESKP